MYKHEAVGRIACNENLIQINELMPVWIYANKTLLRSQTKSENDYISEDGPTSAKILDVHRCALQFEQVESLMKFLGVFEERVS